MPTLKWTWSGKWWLFLIGFALICFACWVFWGGKKYPYEGLDAINDYFTHYHSHHVEEQSAPSKPVSFPPVPIKPKREKSAFKSVGQRICHETMERIFGKPFEKDRRPNFMKNPLTGRNLELDGFNEEYGVAFEYNGEQHYLPSRFLKTREQRAYQAFRDEMKPVMADAAGIFLITVPYWVEHSEIESFIIKALPPEKRKFLLPAWNQENANAHTTPQIIP